MGLSGKVVVIDCRDHLLGRLASIIAKQLLQGQRVVAVRCELLVMSGSIHRNKIKWLQFIKKRTNTNPKRGPIHFHAPSKVLWRTIRGMIPHKTARGEQAMLKFKSFEGIPAPYDKMKRMVVPEALRSIRIRPGRKITVLGDMLSNLGWKHKELISTLEEKRKVKSAAYYASKKEAVALKAQAAAEADVPAAVQETLAQYGY